MSLLVRVLGFALSTVGCWESIRKRSDISIFFIPSLTISIHICFLLLCGLLNLLREGVWVLFLFGLVAFFCAISRKEAFVYKIQPYKNHGFLFLVLSLVVLAGFVKGKIFTHFDSFSHWALVVRTMLEVDRFPNHLDELILFQQYPLGSAVFIYYFAKVIGSNSESLQMLAQAYILLSAIFPLFYFAKDNKWVCLLTILFASNCFLCYNTSITDLLVDTLLPLVGMSGFLFAMLYCGKNCSERNLLFAACQATALVQIKNSGVFFAAIICVRLLLSLPRVRRRSVRLACAAAPFFSLLLWHKHCDYAFSRANHSKHAFTLSNFRTVFSQKSSGDIRCIVKDMLVFTVRWKDIWLALGLFLVLGILMVLFAKPLLRLYRNTLLASIGMYLTYQVGMLGMYLFSMPGQEALNLAGNVRYAKSIILAILYLWSALAIKMISSLRKTRRWPVFVSAAIIPACFCWLLAFSTGQIRFALNDADTYHPEERLWIESTAEMYGVAKAASYCFVAPKDISTYTRYLGRYILQSNQVEVLSADDVISCERLNCNYIFIYDEDNVSVKDWIAKCYPEQCGARVIIQDTGA